MLLIFLVLSYLLFEIPHYLSFIKFFYYRVTSFVLADTCHKESLNSYSWFRLYCNKYNAWVKLICKPCINNCLTWWKLAWNDIIHSFLVILCPYIELVTADLNLLFWRYKQPFPVEFVSSSETQQPPLGKFDGLDLILHAYFVLNNKFVIWIEKRLLLEIICIFISLKQ